MDLVIHTSKINATSFVYLFSLQVIICRRVELLDVLNQVKEHDIDQNQMLAEEIILLIEE